MRTLVGLASSTALALVASLGAGPGATAARGVDPLPSFEMSYLTGGPSLRHVWDVKSIGNGRFLLTERDTAKLWLANRGRLQRLRFPSRSVWVSGETGLMSLEVDPGFARNHRLYTCQGGNRPDGSHDVRVRAWHLEGTKAQRRGTLLGGIDTTTGRHGGCRLLIDDEGSLRVGTGDAARGTNPQDLTSLAGKTLRLNRWSGKPWSTNPFADATNRKQRYVVSWGHRNVQGLAQRRDGTIWSAEHGPDRDDEVNRIVDGGDYGWNPVPGYNESVPMTDQSLPGEQVEAAWSSGYPTLATSGAVWIRGKRWGPLNGTLAVAALKKGRVIFLRFDADGTFVSARRPDALRDWGRIRSLTLAPNRDLLMTTDNGDGDGVVRVSPR